MFKTIAAVNKKKLKTNVYFILLSRKNADSQKNVI